MVEEKAKDKDTKSSRVMTLGVAKTDLGMAPPSTQQGQLELKVSWQ